MAKPIAVSDVECYSNYFLVKVKCRETGTIYAFEQYEGHPLDIAGMMFILGNFEIHGFNWLAYDAPMIAYAVTGKTTQQLKAASDSIIRDRLMSWDFYRRYGVDSLFLDQVDLMEVAPGVSIGLKLYAGRMHSKKMQDLPIPHDALITPKSRVVLMEYCDNDLSVTEDLSEGLSKRLEIRRKLSQRFGIDLRSKSDAQIAEAILKKASNARGKLKVPGEFIFNFKPPAWISFKTDYMKSVFAMVLRQDFVAYNRDIYVTREDGVQCPKELEGFDIRVGDNVYRMGIGGLHSREKGRAFIAEPGYELKEYDVRSYYPSLILLAKYYPPAIGPIFCSIYQQFYDERQATTDPDEKQGGKIILNGAYGKLGSKYSILYAPELMIQTTISGQLAVLMLIEALELAGIRVVSANTDSVLVYTRRDAGIVATRDAILHEWQQSTGLVLGSDTWLATFNRSVNDYVAFTASGKIKRKGTTFAKPGLEENKHPDREICADAVVEYLAHGTPIEHTVRKCTDIRKFVRIRRVTGGGTWNKTGEYLGKAVRWYWGNDLTSKILVSTTVQEVDGQYTGHMVASSTGACPCMELPDEIPSDLNHQYYIDEAKRLLPKIGVKYHL